jgi:hypothetical protein
MAPKFTAPTPGVVIESTSDTSGMQQEFVAPEPFPALDYGRGLAWRDVTGHWRSKPEWVSDEEAAAAFDAYRKFGLHTAFDAIAAQVGERAIQADAHPSHRPAVTLPRPKVDETAKAASKAAAKAKKGADKKAADEAAVAAGIAALEAKVADAQATKPVVTEATAESFPSAQQPDNDDLDGDDGF